MCLSKNVFKSLCELYPNTANNLKLRGLERREALLRQFRLTNKLKVTVSSNKVGNFNNPIKKLLKLVSSHENLVEQKPEHHSFHQGTTEPINIDEVKFLDAELNEDNADANVDQISETIKALSAQHKLLRKLKSRMQKMIK